jgi:predicted transcriptional regulator
MQKYYMRVSGLTEKGIELLKQVRLKGFVTAKTQEIYGSGMGFYLAMWFCRDNGLVVEDGQDDDCKKWILTEKGHGVVNLIMKAEEMMEK